MKQLKVTFNTVQLIDGAECMFLFCDCILHKGFESLLYQGDKIVNVRTEFIKLITVA